MTRWLKLSENKVGPRFITDSNGEPFRLFGMARSQICEPVDETPHYGAIRSLCAHFKSKGCNAIRLAISVFNMLDESRDFIEECGGYNPDGMKRFIETYVDPDVQGIIDSGMYVVLDLHEYPENDDKHDPNPQLLIDWARAHYIPLWGELAKFYKDEPMIAMYELWNEPYAADQHSLKMGDDGHIWGGKYNNFDWNYHIRQFFIDCVAEVRKHDKKHMILVSDFNAGWGPGWAVTWLGHHDKLDPQNNTLFSVHACADHLGPRMRGFDDWWHSITASQNVCLQFGEIELEEEGMNAFSMQCYLEMLEKRRETNHYSSFFWRPHNDEENYVAMWTDFAHSYASKPSWAQKG